MLVSASHSMRPYLLKGHSRPLTQLKCAVFCFWNLGIAGVLFMFPAAQLFANHAFLWLDICFAAQIQPGGRLALQLCQGALLKEHDTLVQTAIAAECVAAAALAPALHIWFANWPCVKCSPLVACLQDHNPNLWYADDGTRIGTYVGHNGAVATCDVSCALRTPFLLTKKLLIFALWPMPCMIASLLSP